MSSTITLKLKRTYQKTLVDVTYSYHYDPGVWTLPDGSPGYPSSTDLEIENVHTDACVLAIMDVYTTEELEEELSVGIVEYEQNKE